MKTYSIKKQEVVKKWYLIDADDQVLGRVASRVASILRGKHKATYTPHVDMGDRETSYLEMMQKDPTFALKNAIKGMLPHNRLGRRQLLHVKIYAGEGHPHEAQNPEKIEI